MCMPEGTVVLGICLPSRDLQRRTQQAGKETLKTTKNNTFGQARSKVRQRLQGAHSSRRGEAVLE